MIILDTDHFSVVTDSRHRFHAALLAGLESRGEPLLLPVVAVEEMLRGWLAQVRRIRDVEKLIYPYDRLIRLLDIEEFNRLRKQRVRIGMPCCCRPICATLSKFRGCERKIGSMRI